MGRREKRTVVTPLVESVEVGNLVLSDTDSERRKVIATSYLQMTRQEREAAHRNTIAYVRLGEVYGLTHQMIGETLGITVADVQQLVDGD